MTVARTNPLAPGVYWIDVWFPSIYMPNVRDGRPAMASWLEENADRIVEESETFREGNKQRPMPWRTFHKFQVLVAPTPFPFVELGYPEIHKLATPDQITPADTAFKSSDTVHKSPPEPLFSFDFIGEGMAPLLILVGLFFLFKEPKK